MHVYFECIYIENICGKMLLVVIFGWWVLSFVLLFSACFIMSTLFPTIRKKPPFNSHIKKSKQKAKQILVLYFL